MKNIKWKSKKAEIMDLVYHVAIMSLRPVFLIIVFLAASLKCLTEEPAKAIFTPVEQPDYGLKGQVRGSTTEGRMVAFLARKGSALVHTSSGLVSPTYQVPVKDNQFRFQFLASGEWVLGAYEDTNGNLLLDLPQERFTIARRNPIKIPCRDCNFHLDLDFTRPLQVELQAPRKDTALLWQVLNAEKDLLMTLEGTAQMRLPFLQPAMHIRPFLDLNDSGRGELKEYGHLPIYGPLHEPRGLPPITFSEPWKSFVLDTEAKPDRLQICLLRDTDLMEVRCTRRTRLVFANLKPGEYVPEFSIPFGSDSIIFQLPPIAHEMDTQTTVQFLENTRVQLKNPSAVGKVDIWHEQSMIAHIPQTRLGDFPLPVQGEYHFVFYKDFQNPDPLSPFQKADVEVFPLTPVSKASYEFAVDRTDKQTVPVTLKGLHTGLQGNIIFYKQTGFAGILSTLGVYPIEPTSSGTLQMELPLHGSQTHSFGIDLDSNGTLSELESRLGGQYSLDSLQQNGYEMELPSINEGQLLLRLPDFEGDLWVQLFQKGTAEPLRSDMAVKGPSILSFNGLPLGEPLRMSILEDRNRSSTVDSTDRVHPETEVQIPWLKKKLILQPKLGRKSTNETQTGNP